MAALAKGPSAVIFPVGYVHTSACVHACMCAYARARACTRTCVCVCWPGHHISATTWGEVRVRMSLSACNHLW